MGLAADHADIFEVRGYARPSRGESLPTAVSDERVTFRYRGIDGCERSTFVALSTAAEVGPAAGEPFLTGVVEAKVLNTIAQVKLWRSWARR